MSKQTIPKPNRMEPTTVQGSSLRIPDTVKNATPTNHSSHPASSIFLSKKSAYPPAAASTGASSLNSLAGLSHRIFRLASSGMSSCARKVLTASGKMQSEWG